MLGLPILSFRFRGRTNRLLRIYDCFNEHPDQALHPGQIARETGLNIRDVNDRLEATPELFVKLPRRPDGLTRYRLTTVTRTKSPEDVEKLIAQGARRESWTLYAGLAILICALVVAGLVSIPYLQMLW
jgi:hypothetical protein